MEVARGLEACDDEGCAVVLRDEIIGVGAVDLRDVAGVDEAVQQHLRIVTERRRMVGRGVVMACLLCGGRGCG